MPYEPDVEWEANVKEEEEETHGRMARGGHGLPKISPGLAMRDP
jgi:hypothetical protein